MSEHPILVLGHDQFELPIRQRADGKWEPVLEGVRYIGAPRISIRCETTDGFITGTTDLNVVRVERNDDGSFTAVTDHWPGQQVEVCEFGTPPAVNEEALAQLVAEIEPKAKRLYDAFTANHPTIHCNRFPAWEIDDTGHWVVALNATPAASA